MITTSNVLLISGSGQNVGKTSFSCELISKLSMNDKIVAVKVSPHMHELDNDCEYVYQTKNAVIVKETNAERNKDSGLMLKAGAEDVFYVQAVNDDALKQALPSLFNLVGERMCICESGGLGNFIKPALWIHLSHSQTSKQDYPKADAFISDYNFSTLHVAIQNNTWKLI